MRPSLLIASVLFCGCNNGNAVLTDAAVPQPDLSANVPPDMGSNSVITDGATIADMASTQAQVDAARAPSPDMATMPQTMPPQTLNGMTILGGGTDFLDVSTDQGGNVWAVTSSKVYLFTKAGGTFTYDQSSGLAHAKYTWSDSYWCLGTTPCPTTNAVSFSAIAGGMPGEAFVGNIGYIGDRIDVDPSNGAVRDVIGLEVTSTQQPNAAELMAQQQREVATWHAVIDLNGTFGGTAYFGGWHGTAALHGMAQSRGGGTCGCGDYEEHVHPFSTGGNDVFGGDVHAGFVTREGDIWLGDRKAVYLLPQRSEGANTDLFVNFATLGADGAQYIDVFPGVDDWNFGIAADSSGGVYVASNANGLAYLAPGSYSPTYWTQNDKLPTNHLTGVDIDASGEVWIATQAAGALRYSPSSGAFTQYTSGAGLPSNDVRQVYVDKYANGTRTVYFATSNGIAAYSGK